MPKKRNRYAIVKGRASARKPSLKLQTKTTRFVRQPGKSRKYYDTQTGVYVSRRQRDKLTGRASLPAREKVAFQKKMKIYRRLRDDYIRAKEKKGKKLSKRAAMSDPTLKKTIDKLRQKPRGDSDKRLKLATEKAAALFRLGRIGADDITEYAKVFYANM